MTNDEMLRLACIYAEEDRRNFLDAMAGCKSPEDEALKAETLVFISKLRAYRVKKWGRTKSEAVMDRAVAVPIESIGLINSKAD